MRTELGRQITIRWITSPPVVLGKYYSDLFASQMGLAGGIKSESTKIEKPKKLKMRILPSLKETKNEMTHISVGEKKMKSSH